MDCSLPGSSVHGILQARKLEWVATSFSRDLSDPGLEPRSPTLQADFLPSEPPGKPWWVWTKLQTLGTRQENKRKEEGLLDSYPPVSFFAPRVRLFSLEHAPSWGRCGWGSQLGIKESLLTKQWGGCGLGVLVDVAVWPWYGRDAGSYSAHAPSPPCLPPGFYQNQASFPLACQNSNSIETSLLLTLALRRLIKDLFYYGAADFLI